MRRVGVADETSTVHENMLLPVHRVTTIEFPLNFDLGILMGEIDGWYNSSRGIYCTPSLKKTKGM